MHAKENAYNYQNLIEFSQNLKNFKLNLNYNYFNNHNTFLGENFTTL